MDFCLYEYIIMNNAGAVFIVEYYTFYTLIVLIKAICNTNIGT